MAVSGRGVLIAIVLAFLVPAGCATDTTVSGSGTTAAPPDDRTPMSSAPVTSPLRPPSLAAATREWEAVAGDHFEQSARALEKVAAASATGDDSGLVGGCAELHDTNTVGLQGHLPTPDPALTAELQRMIDDVNIATHACMRYADGHEATDAAIYQDYMSRAVEHLHRAKAILEADLRER